MSTRRIITSNTTTLYFIAFVVIVVAFLLLGGGPWIKGIMHGNMLINTTNWHWPQILISLGLGFLIGIIVAKRRW